MRGAPTNREIALAIGIDELEVERYRGDTFLLGDGSWLIHFAFEMPRGLRQRLTGSFTLIFKRAPAMADARQED
ncbi:hypothetical protein GCM10009504_40440 [Pseudomonas laurentiana]|nr:hypothetical protein GCM10009504_40440 [Pseudomonas laurentiana]